MLRVATYTAFVRDSLVLKDMMPVHRSGGAMWLCNYSTADRIVHLDWSNNGPTWTEQNLTAGARQKSGLGVIVRPYGVVGAGFVLPDASVDANFLRIRLDGMADGDGMFVQFQTASPVPDHPLM